MRHGFEHSQRTDLRQSLKVDPRVIQRSQVLQLTQPELEQAIEAELNENPALERLEEDFEPITDEAVFRVVAPNELRPTSEDFEFRRSLPQDDQAPDWVDLAAATPNLADHVRAQLQTDLRPELRLAAEYVVACLDHRGYLGSSIEEIALANGCSLEDVLEVIEALHRCEPSGIGASSVQECLLIQLRDADSVERKLARSIVKNHLDDFIARRTGKIVRRYKVMPDLVEAAFGEILGLTPYPAESFQPSTGSHWTARSAPVTPDLALIRTEAGWTVEVNGADPGNLRINRSYLRRYEQLKAESRAETDERTHVNGFVQKAEGFIDSLKERRRTLGRIGEYLIRHQESFAATGSYEFLRSLTRSQMAKELGLHESTVSRATMGKFVRLANEEVVAFDVFFKPALRIQKMIEQILAHENPSDPLSDEEIARILATKGVFVARRTVNKYRDRNKLLSSRSRRSA